MPDWIQCSPDFVFLISILYLLEVNCKVQPTQESKNGSINLLEKGIDKLNTARNISLSSLLFIYPIIIYIGIDPWRFILYSRL